MIEMGMCQQHYVDWREILKTQSGALDALQEEKPIGEVRVDEQVKVGELNEEGSMPNPGHGDLAALEFWEYGLAVLASASGQKCFPDHFPKKRTRIKMLGGGKILK